MASGKTIIRTLLVLPLLVLASCNGLSTKNHPPLVFAVNLSGGPVSVSLMKSEAVIVEFSGLGTMDNTHLTKVPVSDGVVLRHGKGQKTTNIEWTDPAGMPYNLRLENGHLYAIVVDPLGNAALYDLPETYSSDPKICFMNALPETLSQIQAAPDWAKNVKIYEQDLAPVVPTEFFSIEPKSLSLFWQTIDQRPKGEFTTAKDPDGNSLRQTFVRGHFYLFLAGDPSVQEQIRDLTPPLD